jgi:hypothetical protein
MSRPCSLDALLHAAKKDESMLSIEIGCCSWFSLQHVTSYCVPSY